MVEVAERLPRRSARVEARKQRTRVAILEAAADLFTRQGYDATTMQEIATRADVGLGTMYGYFPSKEDVLRTVLDGRRRAAAQQSVEAFAAALTVPDKVHTLLENLWNYFYDNRPLALAQFAIDATQPRPEHTGIEPIFSALLELLKTGTALGQVAPLPADITARNLLSTYTLAGLGLGIWHEAEDGRARLSALHTLTTKLLVP